MGIEGSNEDKQKDESPVIPLKDIMLHEYNKGEEHVHPSLQDDFSMPKYIYFVLF